jgi:hypothetical protein
LVGLLALAEAVGMTTAPATARISVAIVPVPRGPGQVATAIGLATAGGLVEGAAVGLASGALLRSFVPDLSVRR